MTQGRYIECLPCVAMLFLRKKSKMGYYNTTFFGQLKKMNYLCSAKTEVK